MGHRSGIPEEMCSCILTSHSILMGCEREGDKRCGLMVGLYGNSVKDAVAVAECKSLDSEGCDIVLGPGVLSQAEEEELCNYRV